MGNDPFEEQLRPAFGAKFRGECRQRFAFHAIEHRAFGERPVDDDRNAALLCGGKQALFRLRFSDRIIHLHEIHVGGADGFFQAKQPITILPSAVFRRSCSGH